MEKQVEHGGHKVFTELNESRHSWELMSREHPGI